MNFGNSTSTGNSFNFPSTKPKYELNLIRNLSIPPDYTFTRNSSGTYVGPDGLIKTAVTNQPRFDYDPTTGAFRGLLVESQLTLGGRIQVGGDNLAGTANVSGIIAPDGSQTAIYNYASGSGSQYATIGEQFAGNSNGKIYTISVFAKAKEQSRFTMSGGAEASSKEVVFDVSTGTIIKQPTHPNSSASITPYKNGWYRCSTTFLRESASTNYFFFWLPMANATTYGWPVNQGMYFWGLNIAESSSYPTSWVDTRNSGGNINVTRQPDQLVLNKPLNSQGTFFVEATTTTGTALAADNGTNAFLIRPAVNTTTKNALYYNTNRTLIMSSTGTPYILNAIDSTLGLNRVSLGFDRLNNTSYINGYIKKFMYYDSPVTEDNLRSLTGNLSPVSRSGIIVTSGLLLNLDAGNSASYPGSGTTWTDLSGNGNNGTLTNGPTYSSSNGGSLVFDGVNDLVNLNSSLNLSTNSGFTMCLFLQANPTQLNSTWNYFYSRLSPEPEIEIGTFGTSGTSFTFKDNTVNSSVTSGNVVSSWSYVAFGTNPTTRTPFIRTFNSSGNFLSTSSTAFSNTTIGFERLFSTGTGGGPSGTQYYGAKCAVIQAYNRALTAAEIQQNFNALRGRFGI